MKGHERYADWSQRARVALYFWYIVVGCGASALTGMWLHILLQWIEKHILHNS